MEPSVGSEKSKPELMGPKEVQGIEDIVESPTKSESPDIAESRSEEVEKFKPGWRLLAAFASIAIVNLATALDATIISVALPVRFII
jgi:hypothetical protein